MNKNRDKNLNTLHNTDWDLIIIGGGITGAGILQEAVRHGLKAILLEQKDFAWGTSSRSGQLVHGGLRYLGQGNLRLTYESVRERKRLLRELPGLVDIRRMIMPFYRGKRLERWIVRLALLVYDLMNGQTRKHRYSVSDVVAEAPDVNVNGLLSGLLFHESVTDDARLVLRVLHQAIDEGGIALNYCKVTTLLKQNKKVTGVVFEDQENGTTYKLQASQVINATGVWADNLRQQINKMNNLRMRPLRGSHLVLPSEKLPISSAIIMTHPETKRPGFALPWEGRVLVGNTDIDHKEDLDMESSATAEEITYLLDNLRYHFPNLDIQKTDIISTFSGVRPVIDSGKEDPSAESRDHAVWHEDGLLTVTGGKLTTFRLIALDALKASQNTLGPIPALKKAQPISTPKLDFNSLPDHLSEVQRKRLLGRYGQHAFQLLSTPLESELEEIPETLTLWAELRWAAREESVVHLEDLMFRRTRLALLLKNGGKDILPKIKSICQPGLAWTDQKWDEEVARYLNTWNQCYGKNESESSSEHR